MTTECSEEEGLEQFMEVITQYRCKFCDFTANTTRDMALHVNLHTGKTAHHVNKQPVLDSITEVNIPQTEILPSHVGSEESVVIPQEAQQVVPPEISQGINHFNGRNYLYSTSNVIESGHTLYSTSNPSLEVPYSGAEALSEGVIITLSNGDENVALPAQSNIVRESIPMDNGLNNFQFIKQNADGEYILQNSENVKFDKNGTVQVLVQDTDSVRLGDQNKTVTMTDSYTDSIIMTDSAVNTLPSTVEKQIVHENVLEELSGEAADDGEVVTKELYLCGSCSECFSSIQECKDHMTNIHEVTDFQTSGKVDAGTQMEPRKKVGRKKKCEKVVARDDEGDDDEMVLSESDEDWTEQMLAYPTRSQRKRKPPQALRDDYYLGRTKKREPVKRGDQLELNIKCSIKGCSARFKDEGTMEAHLKCHIEDAGPSDHQYRCLTCEETFPIWKQARYHMWKVHREDIGCLLTCNVCNNFKTDVPSKLKIHMEIHSADRPYACPVCGKTFKQFSQMKNHEHSHTSLNDSNSLEFANRWHTPKTCDICGRKFANVKCMKMHRQAVHGDKKQFKCDFCNYECTRKAMLMLHHRTHTGEKPFKCEICSYSCSDHNSLRRHKMRHSGVKPYKCPHCPYSCIQAISLKVHIKNKHPGLDGIYCCDMCLYRTVNEQQYKNHINDHKNGLIKTEAVKTEDSQLFVMKNVPGKDGFVLSRADGRYDTVTSQDSVIQVLQAPDIQSSSVQHILQSGLNHTLPASTFVLDGDHVRQVQIRMNETGENVVVEDFSRIGQCETLPHNDMTAAQLIYTALNAIAETADTGTDTIDSQGLIEGVENGTIQTSIETNSSKAGETNHVITFHLAEGEELKREVTFQEQPVLKEEMPVVQVQANGSNWPVM